MLRSDVATDPPEADKVASREAIGIDGHAVPGPSVVTIDGDERPATGERRALALDVIRENGEAEALDVVHAEVGDRHSASSVPEHRRRRRHMHPARDVRIRAPRCLGATR